MQCENCGQDINKDFIHIPIEVKDFTACLVIKN